MTGHHFLWSPLIASSYRCDQGVATTGVISSNQAGIVARIILAGDRLDGNAVIPQLQQAIFDFERTAGVVALGRGLRTNCPYCLRSANLIPSTMQSVLEAAMFPAEGEQIRATKAPTEVRGFSRVAPNCSTSPVCAHPPMVMQLFFCGSASMQATARE
jgi:hypothetical protein